MDPLHWLDCLAGHWLDLRTTQAVKNDPELTQMEFVRAETTPIGADITVMAPSVVILADEAAALLNKQNVENYLTFEMMPRLDRGKKPIRVTVQWASRLSPERKAAKFAEELRGLESFHPRAMKLMRNGKGFVVVAEDEPYFIQVYGMIRCHELEIGRWTDEDERAMLAAIERNGSWRSR